MKTEKVKPSLDKKFLVIASAKLILVQIIFLWLAILIGKGDEKTFIQFPIFYGWLVLPVSYLKYFASSSDTIFPGFLAYLFFIPITFLLLSVIVLVLIWKRKISKMVLTICESFHFVGTMFCIVSSKHEAWLFYPFKPPIAVWVLGILIALSTSLFLWHTFFQIANYREHH